MSGGHWPKRTICQAEAWGTSGVLGTPQWAASLSATRETCKESRPPVNNSYVNAEELCSCRNDPRPLIFLTPDSSSTVTQSSESISTFQMTILQGERKGGVTS